LDQHAGTSLSIHGPTDQSPRRRLGLASRGASRFR
jgi:hypothetical protein